MTTVAPFDRRILEEGDTASSNAAADHADQLQRVPILQGRLVAFTFPAGEQSAHIEHLLARKYLGAFIVGQDNVTALFYNIATPERTDGSSDGDSAVNFLIGSNTPAASDQALRAWVF